MHINASLIVINVTLHITKSDIFFLTHCHAHKVMDASVKIYLHQWKHKHNNP